MRVFMIVKCIHHVCISYVHIFLSYIHKYRNINKYLTISCCNTTQLSALLLSPIKQWHPLFIVFTLFRSTLEQMCTLSVVVGSAGVPLVCGGVYLVLVLMFLTVCECGIQSGRAWRGSLAGLRILPSSTSCVITLENLVSLLSALSCLT